jgi:hypothetical protein
VTIPTSQNSKAFQKHGLSTFTKSNTRFLYPDNKESLVKKNLINFTPSFGHLQDLLSFTVELLPMLQLMLYSSLAQSMMK